MITQFDFIRNIGQFEHWSATTDTNLEKITLVYAPNAKGKTTLTTILRSLATADPLLIAPRRRIRGNTPPDVKITTDKTPINIYFNNSKWSDDLPEIHVFDESFIENNVYSGLQISASQRSSMHDLINGQQGAALQTSAQYLRQQREEIGKQKDRIRNDIEGYLQIATNFDEFLKLPQIADLIDQLRSVEDSITAIENRDVILKIEAFRFFNSPSIELIELAELLNKSISRFQTPTVSQVREHVAQLGDVGEKWLKQGFDIHKDHGLLSQHECPFCLQDLASSPIFDAYNGYFSEAYTNFIKSFQSDAASIIEALSPNAKAAFNAVHDHNATVAPLWERYQIDCQLIDNYDDLSNKWDDITTQVQHLLTQKQQEPFKSVEFPDTLRTKIDSWNKGLSIIGSSNQSIDTANESISQLKERTTRSNISELRELRRHLLNTQLRHSKDVAVLCKSYIKADSEQKILTRRLNECTSTLNTHRQQAFEQYQTDVNQMLKRMGVNFTISSLEPTNHRYNYYCIYRFKIRGREVPLELKDGENPVPSFSTTLSAGDRNSLAFAIYMASFNTFDKIDDKIVVFDDPLSSQDTNRTAETIRQIVQLNNRVEQLIVLSHRREFLARIWRAVTKRRKPDPNHIVGLQLRGGDASWFEPWDADGYRQGERREVERQLEAFVSKREGKATDVIQKIRPHLEQYLSLAYPTLISTDDTLGDIVNWLSNPSRNSDITMSATSIDDLQAINDYTSPYHHADVTINVDDIDEDELETHILMTLDFIRKH